MTAQLPTTRERLIGRLRVAEERLRLLAPDGVVDAANRAQVDALTARITAAREELAELDAPVGRRYPDPD
jgi:hypothetical protein